MTTHKFLTADRSVQQTTFANGTAVTVNFGQTPYKDAAGNELAPNGIRVKGTQGAAGR
jgi:hypothetical protein